MADPFSDFGTGAASIYEAYPEWGGGAATNNAEVQGVQQGTQLFKQAFQNLLGRAPTADELGQYQSGALFNQFQTSGWNPTYGDQSGLANAYVQNQFGPQAAQYQQQQQTSQLGTDQNLVQNMVNQTMGNTAAQFSNPNSSIYQAYAGNMNNLGISPSSGAFQAGAGSTIANSGLDASNSALQSIGIPGVQQIGQTGQNPYQNSFGSGQSALSNLENQFNFNQQSALGRQLADMSQPSTAQKDIGMASGASNALSNLMGSGAQAQMTSYVCLELINRGLLCEMDMDDFHVHIMPAMFKKGRAFWKYAVDGKRLVDSVNDRGLDWKVFKPLLFDRVMAEPDPCRAVDLYADACHQLCLGDPSLWDERVFRTSLVDSIPFLPALLCYKPFQKALLKCLRIKTLILYDRPRCQHASR